MHKIEINAGQIKSFVLTVQTAKSCLHNFSVSKHQICEQFFCIFPPVTAAACGSGSLQLKRFHVNLCIPHTCDIWTADHITGAEMF